MGNGKGITRREGGQGREIVRDLARADCTEIRNGGRGKIGREIGRVGKGKEKGDWRQAMGVSETRNEGARR